jgi:hypothetical protein
MRTSEELSYLSEMALKEAGKPDRGDQSSALLLAKEQVWATLALAAATQEADLRRFPGIG